VQIKNRKWRETHREQSRAAAKSWRDRNVNRARENFRNWARDNPEKAQENYTRRRARLAGAVHETWTRGEVWERGSGVCHICSAPLDFGNWHADHVIPLSRGGRDALDNLLPACPLCNWSKGNKEDFNAVAA
jgi:5-methylcytosine-specific restriction endonuclease McrA